MDLTMTLLYFGGFMALMYFMIIRPQQKKTKALRETMNALKVGDRIVTIGGMNGVVTELGEDTFVLEIGHDGTKVIFQKWALREVVNPTAAVEETLEIEE